MALSPAEVAPLLLQNDNERVSLSTMQLKTFLLSMPVKARHEFAARCGTSYQQLLNIAYNGRACAAKLAVSIMRESDGRVLCDPLHPQVDWDYVRSAKARRQAHTEATQRLRTDCRHGAE